MFNSRQYEWADITVYAGKRDVTGIRAIKYVTKQEKEPLHGKGNMPLSIQKGNITNEGEMGLLQSELEALEVAAGGSILNLQLNVVVNYGNPSKGDMVKTDELIGVQFTEDPRNMRQGDKFMDVVVPFIFLEKKPTI